MNEITKNPAIVKFLNRLLDGLLITSIIMGITTIILFIATA